MQGKQPRHCVFRPVASLLIALALAPAQAAPLRCTGIELVSLLTLEPRPLFELRYASPYNVLGTSLYPQLNPQLRCPVALALQHATGAAGDVGGDVTPRLSGLPHRVVAFRLEDLERATGCGPAARPDRLICHGVASALIQLMTLGRQRD